jgi:probable phosphoglycerate mutase
VRTIDLENPFVESLEGMCEVLLVRHGEQQFYRNIPLGEALDAPLSTLGRAQAQAAGSRLAAQKIERVYASPMQRAHDTGKEIARHHGLEPVVVDDLREIDLWQKAPQEKGLLDLYSPAELAEIYRQVSRLRSHSHYPHCEDVPAFRARIIAALDRIIEESTGMRVVVACHGGVINAILSQVLGSGFDHLVTVHHTSITVLRAADTRRELLTINDYAHVFAVQSARSDMNA